LRRAPWWTGETGSGSVRTLILSPDTIFAEALSACLAAEDGIEVVGLALDPATVGPAIDALEPAVVLFDQRSVGPGPGSLPLPGPDARVPLRTVLVATMAAPTAAQAEAFDAVVPPRSSLDRVIAAIREVARDHRPRIAHVDRAEPTGPPLTGRELEVLRLLAVGATTRAMAGQLHLSQHTVRNHVRRLTAKLGVRSRLEAVVEGRRLGYL
jgi:DNA-binding NarL/FixJ family response regulator